MHRNPKNTRNTDDFLGSGTKLLLPYWLLGFQHEERERHNFYYADCSIWPQQRATHSLDPTGLASPSSENQLAPSKFKSQLTAFFQKSPKIISPSLPGITPFTSPVSFHIRRFYYDICDCHILPVRAWTPALHACPYPCTKPNSSKPN